MLTARSDDIDAIVGLELGADDYVTKPFNPRALVARVKAILRRTEVTNRGGRPIEVGTLRIDPRRRDATVGDRRLELRAREFDLLLALARDPGVVLTRDALLEDVWGTDFPGETRTVDVHVGEVRKKLGDDGPAIETLRGVGYRLVPPRSRTGSAARRPIPPDRARRCPVRCRGRIGLAFVVLALATWISVGGALFLVLRGLHADSTAATLTDVATPLLSQVRTRVAGGADVRTALADLRDQLAESGDTVYLVTAAGQILRHPGRSGSAGQRPDLGRRDARRDRPRHVQGF